MTCARGIPPLDVARLVKAATAWREPMVWVVSMVAMVLLVLATAVTAAPLLAQSAPPLSDQIEIELEHDSENERATAEQVRRLVDGYDVERWMWTKRIRIDERAIPHSHPVLTVHTRSLGDEHGLLATFVHEQFHWWMHTRPEAEAAAVAEFRELFPEVPASDEGGARDEYSTYLHLIVCDAEYQAMAALVGDERARAVLASQTHYEWIYETLLNDPRVREVNLRHGFDVAKADARGAGGG